VFHKNSLNVHRIRIEKHHSLLEKLKRTPALKFDFTNWNKRMANIANVQLFSESLQTLFFMSFERHICFHLEPAWKTAFRIYMISAFITIAAANVRQRFVVAFIMIFPWLWNNSNQNAKSLNKHSGNCYLYYQLCLLPVSCFRKRWLRCYYCQ